MKRTSFLGACLYLLLVWPTSFNKYK